MDTPRSDSMEQKGASVAEMALLNENSREGNKLTLLDRKMKSSEEKLTEPMEFSNELIETDNKSSEVKDTIPEITPCALVRPLKENIWFRGTVIPNLNEKNQKFKLLSSDSGKVILTALRNKNREWNIFSDEGEHCLIGKIKCNLLGNFYEIFKSNISALSHIEGQPNILALEIKYVI
ncbi:MAG: hypothetical protein MJ252_15170 [archaeon]|nr:hypothetical protein [archaeon]